MQVSFGTELLCEVLPARVEGEPEATLLLLHGRGSNAQDLLGLAPRLGPKYRYVAPNAPLPVPLAGPGGYAWYEFRGAGRGTEPVTFQRSLSALVRLLEAMRRTYGCGGPEDAQPLFLLGFSQGAVMSLALALTVRPSMSGVVAMSGYLPDTPEWPAPAVDLAGLPILVTHGTGDPIIPVEEARATREALEARGAALTYREYPMGHEVSADSLADIAAWLSWGGSL